MNGFIYWMLFVLNIPLITEILRRFFLYSDVVFVIGDVIAIGTLVWLLTKPNVALSKHGAFWTSVALFFMWGGISVAFTHQDLILGGIGFRAFLLPLIYLLISSYFYRYCNNATAYLAYSVTGWILLIFAVAVAQLFVGRDHPLNSLPAAASGTGIGDFTVESVGLELDYIFRPTSIFLHTGKYGQVIFALVLFKWSSMLLGAVRSQLFYLTVPIDLLAVLLSGQRAAFLFLLLCLIAILTVKLKKSVTAIVGFVGVVIATVASSMYFAPIELSELVVVRYLSGFQDVPLRITENLTKPASAIIDLYGWMGKGLGFFTFGSDRFGGFQMYEYLNVPGTLENSWLRIVAEIGLIGALLYVCVYAYIIAIALKTTQWRAAFRPRAFIHVGVFATCWLTSTTLWSITHDVLANSVGMSVGFALSGAILVNSWWREAASHSYFSSSRSWDRS